VATVPADTDAVVDAVVEQLQFSSLLL
jgi:hypothetical protein